MVKTILGQPEIKSLGYIIDAKGIYGGLEIASHVNK